MNKVDTVQPNRFTIPTGRIPYADKTEYLRALGDQLTPDIWDAILTRAIHDATLGKLHERIKARDWLAKYILPIKAEIQLRVFDRTDLNFLAQLFDIFHKGSKTTEDVEQALALTLAELTPEERAALRAALEVADSPEVKKFWDEARAATGSTKEADRLTWST